MKIGRTFLVAMTSASIGAVGGWVAHDKLTSEDTILEAEKALNQGKLDLALRLAQLQIQESGGKHPNAQRIAARSLARQQKWAEAAKAFEQTTAKSLDDYYLYARSLHQLHRGGEALAVIADGLAAYPMDPKLMGLETRALGMFHRTKEALVSAERLANVPGKEVEGLLLAGIIHYEADNYEQAVATFRKALAISPELEGQSEDFPKTTTDFVNEMIAVSLSSSGRKVEAFNYARDAYNMKPNFNRAYQAAKGAEARNQADEAYVWVERALQHEPENVHARIFRVELLLNRGRVNEAEKSMEDLSNKLESPPADVKHRVKVVKAQIANAKAKRK